MRLLRGALGLMLIWVQVCGPVWAQTGLTIGRGIGYGNGIVVNSPTAAIPPPPPSADDNRYCLAGNVPIYPSGALSDGPATLPTACINTAESSTPTQIDKTVCASGCDFATIGLAVTAAQVSNVGCGWRVHVQPGTYVETVTIAIACNSARWFVLEASTLGTNFTEGLQVNPSYAGYGQIPGRPSYCPGTNCMPLVVMPKIRNTTGGSNAVVRVTGSFVRVSGFEITTPPGDTNLSGIAQSTGDNNIWDRNLIHPEDSPVGKPPGKLCTATINGVANTAIPCTAEVGLLISGTHQAAIHNYIYDIRRLGDNHASVAADSKGVYFGNGSNGPYKLVDNFIEASDENIFSGGGAATVIGSDFEIRLNHTWKPLFWKNNCTGTLPAECQGQTYDSANWSVAPINGPEIKNMFELKNSQRVLAEGNIFENNWTGQSDQDGSAVLLTPKNPDSDKNGTPDCPLCSDNDYTLRYNIIRHTNKGFQLAPTVATQCNVGEVCLPLSLARVMVHDVVFDDVASRWSANPAGTGSNGAVCVKILSDIANFHDVTIQHITCIQGSTVSGETGSFASVSGDVVGQTWANFSFLDSITIGGIKGQPLGSGNFGQCGGTGSTGLGSATYSNLGETGASGDGCFTAGTWYYDGNIAITAQPNFASPNSPYPNPTGNLTSHPSLRHSLPLVGNNSTNTYSTVGFVGFGTGNGGDYHLCHVDTCVTVSPFAGKGTDGKDPGADIDAVNVVTSGGKLVGGSGASAEDMLDWFLATFPARTTNHVTGPGSYHASWKDQDKLKIWAEKNLAGHPWDVNLYDGTFIYFWLTENGDVIGGFNNAFGYKRAITPRPIMPRFFVLSGPPVEIDFPGANPGVITTNCELDSPTTRNLNDVKGITTYIGAFPWGGDIGTQPTVEVDYYYNGVGGVYQHFEKFFLVKPYGWISWELWDLSGGVYTRSQQVINNTFVSGGAPVPSFPCGTTIPGWLGGPVPVSGGNIN